MDAGRLLEIGYSHHRDQGGNAPFLSVKKLPY